MKGKKMNDLDLLKTKIRIFTEEDFESLHSIKINKNTKIGCYNCFSIKQAFTNQDNPKRQNSFQSTSCNGDACSSHYYQGSYNKVKQILVAENEYMFGSNVNNKIELQTKYITIVDALRLNWDLIDERQVKQIIRSFPQLNPEIINKIVAYLNKNPDISLDLLGLTDISLNGIEQFDKVKTKINLNLDGLSKLTKEAALNLSKLKKLHSISLEGLKTFNIEDATNLRINKTITHVDLNGLKRISTDVLFKLLINTKVTCIALNQVRKITKGKLKFEKIDKKVVLDFHSMKDIDAAAGYFFSKLNKETLLKLNAVKLATLTEANYLLCNSLCCIELDGIEAVSDEVAVLISRYKGEVHIQNLN
jgi:hypothetical protein